MCLFIKNLQPCVLLIGIIFNLMGVLLLSDSKGVKPTKNKKKNRRRKNNPKEPSSDIKNGNHKKVGS